MNCRQATRALSDAQDRNVCLRVRVELKLHVMMCSRCRNFAEHMAVLRTLARAYAKNTGGGRDQSEI